jgi:hypothetical protein
MKTETYNILLDAYASLEEITIKLYDGADNAVARDDLNDASLLQSRADILYVQLENLDVVIAEHEER